MRREWKIIGVIGLIGGYTLAILIYLGVYWPLREQYLELPNRRAYQKRHAILFSLMVSLGFLNQIILVDLDNQSYQNIGYFIQFIVTTLFFIDHSKFVKQKK